MRLFALLALACAIAFPAAADVLTATPATLAATVIKAKSGDTITVAGPAAPVVLRSLKFSPPLTITAAGGQRAQLTSLQISGMTGLRVSNLDITNPAPISADSPILFIQSSNDIVVDKVSVQGAPGGPDLIYFGKGISLADSNNVTVSNSSVSHTFKGISLANGVNVSLIGNEISYVRTSPIDGGGLLTAPHFIANHIHHIVPVAKYGDHSDGIHIFTKSGSPVTGLQVVNNVLELADAGGTLGINLQGTPAPGGFYGVKVAGNVLHWNNNQGITTNYIFSGDFSGNILQPTRGLDNPAHAPAFVFRNSGPTVTVTGNTTKCGPSMKPYPSNTCLTIPQIQALGAP